MAKNRTPWTYIGGKTLMFPKIPEINKSDPSQGLAEVEILLQRIRDILEELNRRQYESGSGISGMGGIPYLATVTSASTKGTGWYECDLERYLADGTTEELDTGGVVLNLVDIAIDTPTTGLVAGNKILCWKLSQVSGSILYYGFELYGRSIIGLC